MSAADGNEGGRSSASNNGVDEKNSSSSVRITLQVDNTSALPLFLQGRVRYLCEKKENRRKKGRRTVSTIVARCFRYCFHCVQIMKGNEFYFALFRSVIDWEWLSATWIMNSPEFFLLSISFATIHVVCTTCAIRSRIDCCNTRWWLRSLHCRCVSFFIAFLIKCINWLSFLGGI